MSRHWAQCEDLVIALGETSTRWVASEGETSDADILSITAPGTLEGGTYVIEGSDDGVTADGEFNDGSADIVVPAAGKICQYDSFATRYWRITGPEAVADRTFKLKKIWNAY